MPNDGCDGTSGDTTGTRSVPTILSLGKTAAATCKARRTPHRPTCATVFASLTLIHGRPALLTCVGEQFVRSIHARALLIAAPDAPRYAVDFVHRVGTGSLASEVVITASSTIPASGQHQVSSGGHTLTLQPVDADRRPARSGSWWLPDHALPGSEARVYVRPTEVAVDDESSAVDGSRGHLGALGTVLQPPAPHRG